MEFYLTKEEEGYFFGVLGMYFVSHAWIDSNPNFQKLGGSFSPDVFEKLWNILYERSKETAENGGFSIEMKFGFDSKYSKQNYGSIHERNLLLVGVLSSDLTNTLIELFGENEVKLQIQITGLRQGRHLYKNQILSPEMLVKTTKFGKDSFACSAYGAVSWFEDIEMNPTVPTANLSIKVVVSEKGYATLVSAFEKLKN